MKKILYKSKAIEMIVLMIAVLILVSLWPIRLFHETVTFSIPPVSGGVTELVDENNMVMQSFVAQYDHLADIRLFLREGTDGESFFVRLFNEGQVMIAEEEVFPGKMELPGYARVLMDVDTEVGKMYHLSIQGKDGKVFLGCEMIPMTEMPYAGLMYYADSSIEGMNLAADYNYSVPLRKGKVAVFGFFTIVCAALLISACRIYYRKRERDRLITVEKVVKYVGNPLVAVFTVFCLAAILMGACGKYVLDNTFFFISVLFLSAILFYGINHNRDGQASVVTMEYLKSHIPDLIQSVCIAGALGGCCEYMAGLYGQRRKSSTRPLWPPVPRPI